MITNILWRVKKLLDITDSQDDEKLILLIENAIFQIQAYIHSTNIDGLEPIIAQFVGHLYESGEGDGTSSGESGSSSGGGVEPKIGEIKSESYSGVTFDYTTSADFTSKSSSSSKTSSTTGSGDIATYFNTMIAPLLRSRRKIMTLSHPWVEESPERY